MTNSEDVLKKLWLNCICDHEPDVIDKYIRAFGSAEEVYNADSAQLNAFRLGRAALNKSMNRAERIYRECLENDIHIITIDDKEYPIRLRNICYAPRILYVKGKLPDMDNLLGVAMVGARQSSDDGLEVAYSVANMLASCGAVIVSGMAVGIDRMAHVGALHAGNKTIGVLAGGANVIYPKNNSDLYAKIIQNGAIVSERPPHHPPEGRLYSQRNRIIVGLCTATVIVEGKHRSGTSISARLAHENNRDVFAVPITPLNKNSQLPNSLLKDGAHIVRDAQDIINEYVGFVPELLLNGAQLIGAPVNIKKYGEDDEPVRRVREHKIEPESMTEVPVETIISRLDDEEQIIIVKYLYECGNASVDDISENCGIDMSRLSAKLLLLEMKGIVKRGAGNIYSPVSK